MSRLGAVLWLSFVTGCGVDSYTWSGPESLGPLFGTFLDDFGRELLLGHPTELRTLQWLTCDREPVCKNGQPLASCVLREDGFRAAYADAFTSCVEACGEQHACFLDALSAGTPPSDNAAFVACGTRSLQCQLVSDACDALLVRPSPELASALQACLATSCEELRTCLARAVLADGENDCDAGSCP